MLLAAASLLPGSGARAAEPIPFEVTVVHVSPEPGGVESSQRAQRIDGLLGKKIRYESLRILKHRRKAVPLGDVASVELPTGQRFRFRPMDLKAKAVLVAVDMDDSAQGDFRVPRGKPIVLGGQPYEGGQLVVVLEYAE